VAKLGLPQCESKRYEGQMRHETRSLAELRSWSRGIATLEVDQVLNSRAIVPRLSGDGVLSWRTDIF
jgi:hypothetical protein